MPSPRGLPDSGDTALGLLQPSALGLEAQTVGESPSSLVSEKVNHGASGKQRKPLDDWSIGLFN